MEAVAIKNDLYERGGVNQISYLLFRNIYVLRNAVQFLNKDFIKAVQGGSPFLKLFHKILLFWGRLH